jgi:arabinofuranosyltransferase
MPSSPPIPRVLWGVLLSVAFLALLARLIPEPRTIDDAFITFRYSRNIVEGRGFVYNPGSRTLGTTTPLYTLLMATIGFVTGSGQYPWFALIVNALADAATAVLLALIVHQVTKNTVLAALLGILWDVSPMSVTFAVGGMETSVAILWSVTATYLYLTRHDRWMAFVAALGILTRIDSLIWIAPLMLHQVILHWKETRSTARSFLQRFPWPSWVIFVVTLIPWYVFSWVYFGTLLSRSMSTKYNVYVVDSTQALIRFLQHIATPFFDDQTFGVPGIVVGLVLYPGLAAVGTLYTLKRQPRLLPFLLYPWFYVVLFSAANPLVFRWYLAPMLPAYFLAILLGIWALTESISLALKHPRVQPVPITLIGVLFVTLSLHAWTLHPDHGPHHPAPDMAWHKIELYYQQMSELLRQKYGVNEHTLVAAGDIGAVGYYTRAHILDTVGLVTPEMSRYYPLDRKLLDPGQNYAVPPAIIFDYQPDYIVFMEMFVRNGLALDPKFDEMYAQIAFIPTDFYGKGMILYQRRDLESVD